MSTTDSPEHTPQPDSRTALRCRGFIRGASSAQSITATRRLIETIAEWNEDSMLTFTITSKSSLQLWIEQTGARQPGWRSDMRSIFAGIAELRRARPPVEAVPPTVLRVLAQTRRPGDLSEEHTGFDSRREFAPRRPVAHPLALPGVEREMLPLLAELRGSTIRIHISPASALEQVMLDDALESEWAGRTDEPLAYRGACVRIVTLLGSTGNIPARLRAHIRRWGTAVEFEPADPMLWNARACDITGTAVPEEAALSLARIPVAGDGALAGVRTIIPGAPEVPLDPEPARPQTPVRLGTARTGTRRRTEVALDIDDLVRHVFVEGASGSGKSTALAALCVGVAEAGYGVTLIEGHGTTVDAVAARLNTQTAYRARVVRHGDAAHPVPVNVFGHTDRAVRERSVEEFVELMQAIYDPRGEGIVGPRWRTWFSLLAETGYDVFGGRTSIVSLAVIGGDLDRVRKLAQIASANGSEAGGRLLTEYGRIEGKEATELTSWAMSKLHALVSSHAMRRTLGTGVDAIHVDAVMDEGTPLLVDLGMTTLGVPAARMLGSLWLLKHWVAMSQRKDRSRPHVIVVDEAHLFQFGALPALISEGRKFGVGVVVATQSIDALPFAFQNALDTNAGSTLSFRASSRSALRAGDRLRGWSSSALTRLPDLHAATVLSRAGIPTEPFTLQLDPHPPADPAAPQRTQEIDDRSHALLSDPYQSLPVPTATTIDAELHDAYREARRTTPRPPDSGEHLDNWLADRTTRLRTP
jgi:hypothetical protein